MSYQLKGKPSLQSTSPLEEYKSKYTLSHSRNNTQNLGRSGY